MEAKDWTPIAAAVITGILANLITQAITSRRVVTEAKKKNHLEQLQKVYAPIVRVFNEDVNPGDGYDGLTPYRLRQINRIVQENVEYVDPQLSALVWSLMEDEWHEAVSAGNDYHILLDEDGKLMRHVFHHFQWLKKQLHLPYHKEAFWPYPMLEKWKERRYRLSVWWHMKIKKRLKRIFKRNATS